MQRMTRFNIFMTLLVTIASVMVTAVSAEERTSDGRQVYTYNGQKVIAPPPEGGPNGETGQVLDLIPSYSRDYVGDVSKQDPWDLAWDEPNNVYKLYVYIDPRSVECFGKEFGGTEFKVYAGNLPEVPPLNGRSPVGRRVGNYCVVFDIPAGIGEARINMPIESPAYPGVTCWGLILPSLATVYGNDNGYRFDFRVGGKVYVRPGPLPAKK